MQWKNGDRRGAASSRKTENGSWDSCLAPWCNFFLMRTSYTDIIKKNKENST